MAAEPVVVPSTLAALAEEATKKNDEKKEKTRELTRDMFDKVADYVNGELAMTCEEYDLLLRLNQVTIAKYNDMTTIASGLADVSQRLNDKFVSLQQYCDQIDQVDTRVAELEQTAYRLDSYAKQLEARFKALERK
ncbi:PREDICTED: biogenesis of lysosome-related organelles complex 1 subunit 2-like [Amphimedon queenslandica]|uniref:Biogenesis of lysosome-related organelles complex 1 subunit 2 n=1 Tax=Amphimedon queenslandica TaxID=400682 RepID=A0A1X7TXM2_AMPQE|nr:PREDICTED: biogenesis of lysosome-related organelles complex 1 subunit 2-like [Amphimedon queenslandica]|eukprot:XP_003389556.1 PREDICTED: biogenesis of lysosome-related organelles complex 1 subunit 2-like [Amphimedon queenslandica]